MRRPLVFSAALMLACCGRPALPPLPEIDSSRFQPSVRAVVEKAALEAKAKPEDAVAVERLGMALHAHSQFGPAAECFARASALDPQRFEARYYWGAALAANGDHRNAAAQLRQALSLRGGYAAAEHRLAESLLANGDLDESRRVYRKLVARDGRDAAAHYGLGRTLSGTEAQQEFERALELFPRYGAAQFALAGLLRRSGDAAGAARVLAGYERDKLVVPPMEDPLMAAVSELNAGATSLISKGRRLESEGRLKEATEAHREAVRADPKMAQAWINLISLHGRQGEFAQAEEAFRKAVELEPNRGEAYYNFGVLCFGQEKLAEAKKAFERAVALDPNHAESANNLGAIYEREGQFARAAELFRKAVELKPRYPMAHFHLGRLYANQRNYSLAIAELEKSLQPEGAETPVYLYALGAVHGRTGDRAKAVALMQDARRRATAAGMGGLAASIDRDLRSLGAR